MKTLAILILFCASLYGADVTVTTNTVSDITTITSERRDKDGKPELRIESIYRAKTKVMTITSKRNKQGMLAVTSRGYFANGKLVMAEADANGDGIFESFSVFDPRTDDFEMFTRQPDGAVKPVSTQTLELIKQKKEVADESLRMLLQKPDISEKEIGDLLQENRRKIKEIDKK